MELDIKKLILKPQILSMIITNVLVLILALVSSLSTSHLLIIYIVEFFILVVIAFVFNIFEKFVFKNRKISLIGAFIAYMLFSVLFLFYFLSVIVFSKISQVSDVFPDFGVFLWFCFAVLLLTLGHLWSLKKYYFEGIKKKNKNADWSGGKSLVVTLIAFPFALPFGGTIGMVFGSPLFGVVIFYILIKILVEMLFEYQPTKN